jgi:hypothetical protein
MRKRKSKKKVAASRYAPISVPDLPKPDTNSFVPGPKLRRMCGISAVTLWRWRHNPALGFPPAKGDQRSTVLPMGRRLRLARKATGGRLIPG